MRPEFKWGLLTGTLICAWILVEYRLGFHTNHLVLGTWGGYFSNLIPLGTLYFLLKGKRDATPDGELSIRRGINAGLFASFVAALIVYTFSVVYHQLINPGWIDQVLDVKVAAMRGAGQTESEVREMILTYRNAYSPTGLLTGVMVGMILLGGFYSLALTAVFQLRPRREASR